MRRWASIVTMRQIERIVACRCRQPIGGRRQLDHQRKPGRGDMRQAHDAEAAHLEQAGQSGRRRRAMPSAMSTRSSATRSKPRASRRSTRSDLPAPGGPISSTPSPARLAQLPWICMTAHCGPVRGGKEAGLSPGSGDASVAAMLSRKDIAAAAARIAAHVRHTPILRIGAGGAGSRLSGDAEAGTSAACRQFQAARRVQSVAVGELAAGRGDRRIGRQPRRGGRLCRARAWGDGGDLRARR